MHFMSGVIDQNFFWSFCHGTSLVVEFKNIFPSSEEYLNE